MTTYKTFSVELTMDEADELFDILECSEYQTELVSYLLYELIKYIGEE